MKTARALLLTLGLVASALVISATSASASPCGKHVEAGIPPYLWWHNCRAVGDLVEIHWVFLPNQTVCIPAGEDQAVAATNNFDNPIDNASDLTLAGDC